MVCLTRQGNSDCRKHLRVEKTYLHMETKPRSAAIGFMWPFGELLEGGDGVAACCFAPVEHGQVIVLSSNPGTE